MSLVVPTLEPDIRNTSVPTLEPDIWNMSVTLMMVLPILNLAGDSMAGRLVTRGRKPELSTSTSIVVLHAYWHSDHNSS